jgi:hypothetical protein
MAIEPKSPRKRAVKKSTKKSLAPSSDVPEVTAAPVAAESSETTPKTRKKAAVPVPVFQAPAADKAPAKASDNKKAQDKKVQDKKPQ